MTNRYQTITGAQILSTLTLFCYGASLLALLAVGYALIALGLNVVSQEVGAIYSLPNM